MIHDIETVVASNHALGNGNFLLEFRHETMAEALQPGQFVMVGMPGTGILLRRPFSVCGLSGTFAGQTGDAIRILYKVMGQGTKVLSDIGPGAKLTILGPLGNGFPLPEKGRIPVFIAGGIGSAPFPALASAILRKGGPRPVMFYGARAAGDLPLKDWFQEHCETVHFATEDGSEGQEGLVTAPLIQWLESRSPDSIELYACGPEPMLRAIHGLVVPRQIRCHLSLEAHMACGFGVCIGCVVPTHGSDGEVNYTRICVDGPVLPAEKLAW
jgi:dihydroorotate dehydrogenase electron transfer subunit